MIPPRIPITTRDSNHHQDKLAFLTPEISTKKPSFWEPLVRSCFFGYRFVPWEKKPSRSPVANEGKNLNGEDEFVLYRFHPGCKFLNSSPLIRLPTLIDDNLSKYAVTRGGVPAIQPALPAPRPTPMLRGPWRLGR